MDKQSKNIAFTPACQAATHLLSLPVLGTDPSQAAKQSPNRTLKLAPLHQVSHWIRSPANRQCREKGGERKRKSKWS